MKIVAVRALQLGDMLCAMPALRALHGEYPAARITLVGLPWAREIAARFRRYLYDFIEFPGFPGMPERPCDPAALPPFFDAVKDRRYDLAIQLHGSGEIMNRVVAGLGARRSAGFYRAGQPCPDPERFVEWCDGEHEVLRYLRLVEHLGVAPQGAALEFPLGQADWREWHALGLARDAYAVIHPGAQQASRRWPAERFAAVADALAAVGLRIVLTGTSGEAPLVERVKRAMRSPALQLAGLTTLGGLAALAARARLVVANDTGISRIAAAVKAPSVIVATGSDARRWAPLDRQLHRVLHYDTECVSAEEVINEARAVIACVV